MENKLTATIIFGVLILLAVISATSPPLFSILLPFIVLSGVSYFGYAFSSFKSYLIGISFKQTFKTSVLYGIGFGFLFWIISKFIPGASIGLPMIPQSLSGELRFFLIFLVAPLVEEPLFRGILLGYLKNVTKNVWTAIILSSVLFALAHVGAYISGIYNYPSLASGLSAFMANSASFLTAFIFGIIASIFVIKTKNLSFSIIFHMMVNLIIYTSLSVIFVQ